MHFYCLSINRVLIVDVYVVVVVIAKAKIKSKMQINQSHEKVLEMVILN